MPKFNNGEVVLKKWSNAKVLKNKIVKIIQSNITDGYRSYEVLTGNKSRIVMKEYSLESFEEREQRFNAELSSLQKHMDSQLIKLRELRKEKTEHGQIFPNI